MRCALLSITFVLLTIYIEAAPTTESPTISATSAVKDGVDSTTPTPTPTKTATSNEPNEILRHSLSVSPKSHRLRGRVILANTRMGESDDWGVNADQAEQACDRIARYQSESRTPHFQLSPIMEDVVKHFIQMPSKQLEGHLLSIGSAYEVMALARLLNPLPKGSYWTGGRLTRFRVNNMHKHDHDDHIILTWTDGRVGRSGILGMSELDEQQLREGYTYCLALNLKTSSWQARECSDLLPYACLITPRLIGFSNEASSITAASEKPSTTEATSSTTLSADTKGTTSSITSSVTTENHSESTINANGEQTTPGSSTSTMMASTTEEISEPVAAGTAESETSTTEEPVSTESANANLLEGNMSTDTLPSTTESIEVTETVETDEVKPITSINLLEETMSTDIQPSKTESVDVTETAEPTVSEHVGETEQEDSNTMTEAYLLQDKVTTSTPTTESAETEESTEAQLLQADESTTMEVETTPSVEIDEEEVDQE